MSTVQVYPHQPFTSRRPFLIVRLPAGRHGEQAGFSMIELLVVLAIIAITGIIAGLTLLPGRSHARLLNASRDLAGDIRLARQLAVAQNLQHRINFAGAGVYSIQVAPGWADVPGTNRNYTTDSSYKNVTFTVPATNPIFFNPNGTITDDAAGNNLLSLAIDLSRTDSAEGASTDFKKVGFSSAGAVRVCEKTETNCP